MSLIHNCVNYDLTICPLGHSYCSIFLVLFHICRLELSFSSAHVNPHSNFVLSQSIADTMAYMQREGTLLRGEHNILGEAFLVMASAAG